MKLSEQIAKHFREVHFGGNWTVSSLKEVLEGVSWEEAKVKVGNFNTILTLVYHTHYFVHALLTVLEGKPLQANDKFSFDHPPVNSAADWNHLLDTVWTEAEKAAALIEQLPEDEFWAVFSDKKYGNYYRNIHGIIEHTHYHLGQIALIKKIIQQEDFHGN